MNMRPIKNTYALLLVVAVFVLVGMGLIISLKNGMEETRAPMDIASSVSEAKSTGRFVCRMAGTPISVTSQFDTLIVRDAWIERRQWLVYSWLFFKDYVPSDTLKLVLQAETPHGSELHLDVRMEDNRPLRTRLHEGTRLYYLDNLGVAVPDRIRLRVDDRNLRKGIGVIELRRSE